MIDAQSTELARARACLRGGGSTARWTAPNNRQAVTSIWSELRVCSRAPTS